MIVHTESHDWLTGEGVAFLAGVPLEEGRELCCQSRRELPHLFGVLPGQGDGECRRRVYLADPHGATVVHRSCEGLCDLGWLHGRAEGTGEQAFDGSLQTILEIG
jgi:hypothetical protein